MKRPSRVAIVTGHSRGLGAAIAGELLARGVRVLGVARSPNAELAARHGDAFTQVELNLGDSATTGAWLRGDALAAFVRDSDQAFLVNNAGVLEPLGRMETHDLAAVSGALTVNVTAAITLSAAFAQATAQCPDRRILHISSGAGRHVYSGWSMYCASKAALDHHARAVAVDGSPNLRICAVAPGVIDTDMQALIRSSSEAAVPDRQRFVDMKREGRLLDPAEAARRLADLLESGNFGDPPVV